jgi:hypothetical protein
MYYIGKHSDDPFYFLIVVMGRETPWIKAE